MIWLSFLTRSQCCSHCVMSRWKQFLARTHFSVLYQELQTTRQDPLWYNFINFLYVSIIEKGLKMAPISLQRTVLSLLHLPEHFDHFEHKQSLALLETSEHCVYLFSATNVTPFWRRNVHYTHSYFVSYLYINLLFFHLHFM